MTDTDTQLLAELISRKQDCLAQLFELGRQQLALIAAENTTGLLHVLAAKQQLLASLQHIEHGLHPFRGQDAGGRHWNSHAVRRNCAEQLDHCEQLLAQILDQEKRCETALRRHRDEAAARLQGAYSAGHARQAYAAPASPAWSQLDLSSQS